MYGEKLSDAEYRMALLLWAEVPMKSSDMAKRCEAAFGWKRTTIYTLLKRMEQKGIFANQNGTVLALQTKEQYETDQSRSFVEQSFGGSLPKFLAAFAGERPLGAKEIDELKKLIDSCREE
jgi:BlaI family penicillinase repressor